MLDNISNELFWIITVADIPHQQSLCNNFAGD